MNCVLINKVCFKSTTTEVFLVSINDGRDFFAGRLFKIFNNQMLRMVVRDVSSYMIYSYGHSGL